jgi:aerobic carbon-monoxide dehydrogenase large subunit
MDLFAPRSAWTRRGPPQEPDPEVHRAAHHVDGQTYDVGDYEGSLDKALEAAGYGASCAPSRQRRRDGRHEAARHRRQRLRRDHRRRRDPMGEAAKIEIHPDGTASIYTGTSPHGQGHDTAWSMIASAQTGIPMDKFTLVWGDTDLVPAGGGTMGSRSLQQGGAPSTRLRSSSSRRPRRWPPGCSRPTRPTSCSTPTRARSTSPVHRPSRSRGPTWPCRRRATTASSSRTRCSRPRCPRSRSGHVAVVEVDTETGEVRHLRHMACDDAGTGGQPDAARGPDARRRRPGHRPGAARRGALRQRRQPDHVEPRRLRDDLDRPSCRASSGSTWRPHVRQPARRQGHRRVRHDRLDAGCAVGRARRDQPTSG